MVVSKPTPLLQSTLAGPPPELWSEWLAEAMERGSGPEIVARMVSLRAMEWAVQECNEAQESTTAVAFDSISHELLRDILALLDYYIPKDPEWPTVWDGWRDKANEHLSHPTVFLCEDNLSDLIWLVNNSREKLKREDYITDKYINDLVETLEKLLDGLG